VKARGIQMVVTVTLVVAAVGLVFGVRGTGRDVQSHPGEHPPATVAAARAYADMRQGMQGPNAGIQPGWWDSLPRPDLFAPVVQSAEDRLAALARRGRQRAYDGAPPTIPHEIDQLGVPACLSCHEHGARIATLVAPKMSHQPHGNCVQCHVVATDPRPGVVTPPAPETTFVGLAAPDRGERAWPGAPPTIPHSTWMRERCDSCHGPFGANGMKTTHPWRQSCTQCHASSAALDRRPTVPVGTAAAGGAGRGGP
jgi:cytochrome c-type protein NapB